jgi:type IV secretory pathway VirB10-like protein
VLETAIDSDLPGSARAVVSRDVRGFDGTRVLIPRGSKLVGEYRSGISLGHSRAFVIWSRILTPEGISIDVGSPGTDPLGRGGLSGETDSHFFTRFGGAMLLSVLSAGTELAAAQGSGTSIVIGSTVTPAQPATDVLQKQIDIPVTVKVPQGTPLQVFVARDLDFATVPTTPP